MTSNGNDSSKKPTTDELKQWARAHQTNQLLMPESEFTPEEASQPRPISGHPLVKIALVGGLTLPIFVVAGLMMNANRPNTPISTQPLTPPSSSNKNGNSDAKTIADQREALGQTQANYALKEQQDRLKQQFAQKQKAPQTLASSKTLRKPVVQQNTNVEPVQSVSSPAPPVAQRIQPPVISPPQISRPTPVAQLIPVSRESEQSDDDRYLALTQIGSYGQLPTNEPISSTPANLVHDTIPTRSSESSLASETEIDPEEAAILQEQPQETVLASAKAEGILATPIIIDEKTKSIGKAGREPPSATAEHITIQITEPLKAPNNAVILPKGTQLVAALDSLSDSGLIKLNVESAIVNLNGQQVEVRIPPEAIQITGREGQPLIAKQYGGRGKSSAGIDASRVLLGALNRASEQLTRSQSSTIINNNSSIISNVQNSKPNVLAGIVQGGSEALLSSIEQRNQRAIQEIAQQSNIRFLPAGSSVDIYVNQAISLPVTSSTVTSQSNAIDKNTLPPVDAKTQRKSLTPPAMPSSTMPDPTVNLTPEWSSSYEIESSSELRDNRTQLNRSDCNTSNLTCENNYR
jgi:hypothetical protein